MGEQAGMYVPFYLEMVRMFGNCRVEANHLPMNPAARQIAALNTKNKNAPTGNTSVEYWTISSDTEDIVVNAPKNPINKNNLFIWVISKNAKEMKHIRKHPIKFAANTPHDNGSSDGTMIVRMYLATAPTAPPRATIANCTAILSPFTKMRYSIEYKTYLAQKAIVIVPATGFEPVNPYGKGS